MKPETAEWVAKAEGDYATATRERAVVDRPNHDAVCFHAQQVAEKYLKAWLIEAGIAFPRTHDLEALLGFAVAPEPSWGGLRADVRALTSLAVEERYPGSSADAEDAAEAIRIAGLVRSAVGQALTATVSGPPYNPPG